MDDVRTAALLAGGLTVVGLTGLVRLARQPQRLAFGRPWRLRRAPPGPSAGCHRVEDAPHRTDDGLRLAGRIARPIERPAGRWVLYFGGRNEHAAWATDLAGWLGPRWGVRVCNYRGFAGSEGEPSEPAALADGRALARALMDAEGLTPDRLLLVGRSLGATLAVQLAAELPGAALVLFTPPASLDAILSRLRVPTLLRRWLPGGFDALAAAARVRGPALLLLAEHDRVVPATHSRALAAALGGPVMLEVVPGTGHLSLPRHPDSLARVARWAQALDDDAGAPLNPAG